MLPGWRGVHVAEAMAEALGTKVAPRQHRQPRGPRRGAKFGALHGVPNGFFIKVSYGVGAGIILGGEVFRGSAGTAGEIGHVTIDEDGPICRCGNRGCLDTFVGSQAVLGALRDSHGPLTLRDVITRALEGDLGCRRVIEDSGRQIGVAVAGLVNLLNPEVIVRRRPGGRGGRADPAAAA